MAVLNELSGVKVTIEVNHVKAQEYSDEDGPAEDKNNRPRYGDQVLGTGRLIGCAHK
ncbi:hypothetical protein COL154_009319 [Colletotrichum chrysophilum]|nr:hypothetical protein COL154_009319 [Colletotrichum chrysophilum]